jgi:hypothetical protein
MSPEFAIGDAAYTGSALHFNSILDSTIFGKLQFLMGA